MPTIPPQVFTGQVPSQGGMPARVQEVPIAPHPLGNLGASQLVGQAITELGTTAQKTITLAERQADADAVIAAKLKGLEIVPALQSMYATESENADYATFAKRVMTTGEQLLAEGGQGLSPKAHQLYQADVRANLNTLQQRALVDESKRRDQAKAFVLTQTMQATERAVVDAQAQLATATAAGDLRGAEQARLELATVQGQLQKTAQEMVGAGLAYGTAMAEKLQELGERADIQSVQRANRVQPDAMVSHLKALMDNKPGVAGLPIPPRHKLADLYDEAQREQAEAQAVTHRGDLQADKTTQAAQDTAESTLVNQLYAESQKTQPDVAVLQNIQRKIMAAGVADKPGAPPMLSKAGHDRLLGLSSTLLGAVGRQQKAGMDAISDQLEFLLMTGVIAPSPQQPWTTAPDVADAVKKGMKVEAGIRIIAKQAELLSEAHPSKIPEVRQSKTRLREGIMAIITESEALAGLDGETSKEKAAAMQRYHEADRLFDATITWLQEQKQTPQEKIAVAREWAGPLSTELGERYGLYMRALGRQELPQLTHGLEAFFQQEGVTETARRLEQMDVSPPEKEVLLRNLARRQALGWEAGPAIAPPPAKPPVVPSVGWMEWVNGLFVNTPTNTQPRVK